MNYIKRPELLEEIRKSILNNDITYIYGYPGSGKTTICKECLDTYFKDIPVHIIYPYLIDEKLETNLFTKSIYVFEDFDYKYRNILTRLKNISFNVGSKFILLSRKNILDSRVNVIETNILGLEKKLRNQIYELYNYNFHKLAEDIARKASSLEDYNKYMELLLLNSFDDDNINLIYKPCIVDSLGKTIDRIDNQTQIIVTEANDELLYILSKKPELLHNLSSYEFECIVARIFEKQGYSVEITPKTRDGGKDIFIAKQGFSSFLFYVECKKYAFDKPVGIDVIQRLYGVISAEKANGGFIATTSYFTKPAKYYIQEHNLDHQLTLQDYNTISDILKSLQYNTE